MKKRHQQKLIVVSFFLMVIFNIPILLLFDHDNGVMGLPFIYVYLFGVWLLAIIVVLIIVTLYYE